MATLIDVEGAFSHTPIRAIVSSARAHGVNDTIIRWLEAMLSNRLVTSEFGSSRVTGWTNRGCPQGGVLSPRLWCLAVDGLLQALRKKGVEVTGYSDDIMILSRAACMGDLVDLMQGALAVVEEWCRRYGLSVNPEKTECVLFTRKRLIDRSLVPRLFGVPLTYAAKAKYLGVMLDAKLNWGEHVEYASQKFLKGYWLCRRTLGKTWGLSPSLTRWTYGLVLLPRVSYGAVVWWRRAELITGAQRLVRLQGMMLRSMVGAARSTPTSTLCVLTGLMPLHLVVKSAAAKAAARLAATGEWRAGSDGHREISKVPGFHLVEQGMDRIVDRFLFDKKYSVRICSRLDWEPGGLFRSPRTLRSGSPTARSPIRTRVRLPGNALVA